VTNLKPAQYTQEIARLDVIVGEYNGTPALANPGVSAFVSEKLKAARVALKKKDEETAWLNLYGAAKFCHSNQVQPEKAVLSVVRINRLLA
jgi:hypothetical protein